MRFFSSLILLILLIKGGWALEPSYSHRVHPTAASLHPQLLEHLFNGEDPVPFPDESPPLGGTVSHHLLASASIDTWFRRVSSSDLPDYIVVISPAHWIRSGASLKVSSLPWDGGNGWVPVDTQAMDFLRQRLPLGEEPDAFHREHGIGSLIPYLVRYFPGVPILPILQREDVLNPRSILDLADALKALEDSRPEQRMFLMVSIDFSHHADQETTHVLDQRSAFLLPELRSEDVRGITCDNRGGLLLLSALMPQGPRDFLLVDHSDSFTISHQDPQDITSYFFTLFW